jgi:hypothetical protein
MPQAAAELVFMGTVTGIGDTMTATRNVGAGNNVEVWMNIDGGRKIILSGVANGGVFNGGPSGGGPSYPALWINGGAHVTLKNGIQITGNSSTDNESNIADGLSLVTVFNGTLAFEDSADVTTEQQNDAEPLTARKTIGVRIADGSQAAFIELNSTIGPGRPMHVRPVEDWGHTLATTWVSERQILTGPAVASEYMNFRRSNGAAFTADGRFQ